MKISKEKKKEILLESFNVLKDNYLNNISKIQEIIKKMFSIDIEVAVEMWIFLLTKYKHLIKDKEEAYRITENIIYDAEEMIGISKISEIVVQNENLKSIIFSQSASVGYNQITIIKHFICSNKVDIANELIQMIYKNKVQSEHSFFWHIETLLDGLESSQITDDAYNMLSEWAKKITDPEEKAKINVALLGIMSEE